MADEWNSLFNSDDDDSEFEGFSPSDIDETETRSIGSDITIHPPLFTTTCTFIYTFSIIHFGNLRDQI
jgi:hypothetical protein